MASRRLRNERAGDLTEPQFSALAGLAHHGPITPSDLAGVEAVSAPSMTRTIAHLAAAGLADRRAHPQDGRQVLIAITARGERALAETRKRRDAWITQRLSVLSPAERESLSRAADILQRMASA